MKVLEKIYDKMCMKQWNVGLARFRPDQLLQQKNINADYTWLTIDTKNRFFADPFIFKGYDGHLQVLYEDFSNSDSYGKISLTALNGRFEPVMTKELLDTKSHLSYPYVFQEAGKTYIIPEASKSGNLTSYEFDFGSKTLINKKDIITGLPLLDSTILKYEGKYWLFATHRGTHSNSRLYIYYADRFDGPYQEHAGNPVKDNLDGSRPAGDFVSIHGQIYRPTQNSSEYYGKSITLNRIIKLTEKEFEEEVVVKILPPANGDFLYAIHTINFIDDVIVIDGLKRIFMPLEKLGLFIKKKIGLIKSIYPVTQMYLFNEYMLL